MSRPLSPALAALLLAAAAMPAAPASAAARAAGPVPAWAASSAVPGAPSPATPATPVTPATPTASVGAPGGIPADQTGSAALLPAADTVARVLSQSPGVQAARHLVEAEQAGKRQLRVGPHEWALGLDAERRRTDDPLRRQGTDWTLSLERPWRLPGKQDAAEHLGSARVAAAEAAWLQAWREQARALLDAQVELWRERETARVWQRQADLLDQQARAVARRQQLGDASEVERLQAEAAVAQARSQAVAAEGRARTAEQTLRLRFPGVEPGSATGPLPPPPSPAALTPPAGPAPDDSLAEATGLPEWQAAERVLQAQQAALRAEELERRPDPTVGVRVGRSPLDGERQFGVALTVPLGGAYRAAGVQASAARLAAQQAQHDELRRRLTAEAAARRERLHASHASWRQAAEAAARLERSAQALTRGQALGESSLAEVLAARRLAAEQGLAAALAAVDAWSAHWQQALAAGRLWPAP